MVTQPFSFTDPPAGPDQPGDLAEHCQVCAESDNPAQVELFWEYEEDNDDLGRFIAWFARCERCGELHIRH